MSGEARSWQISPRAAQRRGPRARCHHARGLQPRGQAPPPAPPRGPHPDLLPPRSALSNLPFTPAPRAGCKGDPHARVLGISSRFLGLTSAGPGGRSGGPTAPAVPGGGEGGVGEAWHGAPSPLHTCKSAPLESMPQASSSLRLGGLKKPENEFLSSQQVSASEPQKELSSSSENLYQKLQRRRLIRPVTPGHRDPAPPPGKAHPRRWACLGKQVQPEPEPEPRALAPRPPRIPDPGPWVLRKDGYMSARTWKHCIGRGCEGRNVGGGNCLLRNNVSLSAPRTASQGRCGGTSTGHGPTFLGRNARGPHHPGSLNPSPRPPPTPAQREG